MSDLQAEGQGVLLGAVAVLFLGIGLGVGWAIWGRPGDTAGGPAGQHRQPDGSEVLERRPTDKAGTPPQIIPKGGTEERRVSVTIVPSPPAGAAPAAACAPVTLNLSLVRLGDGSARVVASSPDGTVSGGLDMPIASAIIADQPRLWAAGVSYAGQQAFGVFVHRDLWRLRAGLEVNAPERGGTEARLLIGWTF